MAVVGSAEILILPDTTAFGAALRRQLTPLVSLAGVQASAAFSSSFGAAGQQAAREVSSRFTKTASGLFAASGVESGKALGTALSNEVASAAKTGGQAIIRETTAAAKVAGVESGKLVSSGLLGLGSLVVARAAAGFFSSTIKAGLEFEQSFAGVRTATNLTAKGFDLLAESNKHLAETFPISVNEINAIGQQAAELGVKGVAGITQFEKVVIELSETTNISAKTAAEALVRLSNILGLPISQAENLGSALGVLGETSGASADKILAVAQNAASAGARLGLTAPQILGISAAFARVNIDATSSGTAVNKVFNAIGEAVAGNEAKLRAFSTLLALQPEQFKALVRANPGKAFTDITEAIGRGGESAVGALSALGLAGTRVIKAFGGVTQQGNFTAQAIERSTEAFAKNTELSSDAAIVAGTTGGKLKILGNEFKNTEIAISKVAGGALVKLIEGLQAATFGFNPFIVSVPLLTAGLVAVTVGVSKVGGVLASVKSTFAALAAQSGILSSAQQAEAVTALLAARAKEELAAADIVRAASAAESARVIAFLTLSETEGVAAAEAHAAAAAADAAAMETQAAAAALAAEQVAAGSRGAALGVAASFGLIATGLAVIIPLYDHISKREREIKAGATGFVNSFVAALPAGVDRIKAFDDQITRLKENLSKTGDFITPGSILQFLTGGEVDTKHTAQGAAIKQEIEQLEKLKQAEGAAAQGSAAAAAQNTAFGDSAAQTTFAVDAEAKATADLAVNAAAAKSALSAITSAGTAFDSRLGSLLPKFGEFIVTGPKAGAAASSAAKDFLTSARAIADAQRALNDARSEAAKRAKDDQLALSKAEAEAIQKVIDAQRRLDEERFRSTRSVRDAQENLQDFQAALALTGGTITPEDAIKLRELTQAVSDALDDATRSEIKGQQELQAAVKDGNDKIADTRRKSAEDAESSAKRIAEAQLRLARALEDAANRGAKAGGSLAKAAELTAATLAESFRTNTENLTSFADSLTSIQTKLTGTFKDKDFIGPFLSQLQDMGPAAAGFLKKLATESPKELAALATGFEKEVKAAKRAADLQFDKFPPNFKEKLNLANQTVGQELNNLVGLFQSIPDKTSPLAQEVADQMTAVGRQIKVGVEAGTISLSALDIALLDTAIATEDPIQKAKDFKQIYDDLKSKNLRVTADTKQAVSAIDALIADLKLAGASAEVISHAVNEFRGDQLAARTPAASNTLTFSAGRALVHDKETTDAILSLRRAGFASGGEITHAQFGATASVGQPILLGRNDSELFIPNTAGAIFSHRDTNRILAALRQGTGNNLVQNVQINEVAADPRATARAVSFALGSEAIR